MLALLVSKADPHKVPVLMIQGGIHPGESDGKDAGFMTLREILRGSLAPRVLERIAILFVPAFNVDGQTGPEFSEVWPLVGLADVEGGPQRGQIHHKRILEAIESLPAVSLPPFPSSNE